MALATLGTDTGGSIRIPAALCGIVGLKPTYGEVSADGVVPLSRTLDHIGPLAQDVTDAWHLYHVLVGRPAVRPLSAAPISNLRLAVPRRYFCDLLDDEVKESFEHALDRLQRAGARLEVVDIKHADLIAPIYLHIVLSDAVAYHAATLESMPDRYTQPVRTRLEMGRSILAEDYVRALNGRDTLRREVDAALSGRDALVMPSVPIPAPPLGAALVRVGSQEEPVRNLTLRLTQLFDLTGHPAISIPMAPTSAGLPCGFQLAGARGQTNTLLEAALAAEHVFQARN
jgi:aspartyl-tRNA(Asn)/glutamyl-tRNA(Gln) amidotransferase subunit A